MRAGSRGQGASQAPESEYRSPDGDVLALRGAMTPGTRASTPPALAARRCRRRTRGSARVEFLFERLATSWEVAGTEPITRQKELLARFRVASHAERRWIRDVLREHLAEHFPELQQP